MALFKPLFGKRENLPAVLTSGYAYFCIDDGSFWIDYKDSDGIVKRKQTNAQEAEKIIGYDITNILEDNDAAIPVSSAVFSAIEAAKVDLNTSLNGRIDDVENDINTTNETLSGVSQELENYKTINNEAVSTNTSGIEANKAAIEVIQGDYLISTDKEQLQDEITQGLGKIETDFSTYKIEISEQFIEVDTIINNHVNNTNNPHYVTKEQIELGNVDNTSDFDKPISYATQVALDEKSDVGHTHDDLYHTRDELLELLELITVDDIDEICMEKSLGLVYTLNSDGNGYTVSGIGTCMDVDIIIPPKYNGLPVTSIGAYVFSDCSSLTSITIPDSVTNIGIYAFNNCTSLTSVKIPNGVTLISYSLFAGCTSLTSITIPNSVTSIGQFSFYGCTSLTSINMPNVITINSRAFENCTKLKQVEITSTVASIKSNAFANCKSLSIVRYYSTASQWSTITIESGNDYLINAQRYYM